MELLAGFDRAIIIDAIQSGGTPGEVQWLTPQDFNVNDTDVYSQHSIGLLQALELGKDLAQPMPEEIAIVAIEAEDVTSFGEDLTSEVEKAVSMTLEQILLRLNERRDRLSSV